MPPADILFLTLKVSLVGERCPEEQCVEVTPRDGGKRRNLVKSKENGRVHLFGSMTTRFGFMCGGSCRSLAACRTS
jgi:hypothetical protein